MAEATDHPLERLVFFSDAVFAIAITLLIIEIHPPHLEHGASDVAQWQALASLIPKFVGYVVGFWVIGMFWMGHHRSYALAKHYSGAILPWNLMLLMMIAFMPFVTGYFSSNFGERVPSLVYCLAVLSAALLNLKVNQTATGPDMVGADVAAADIVNIRRRSLSVVLGAASAVVLSLIVPIAAPTGLVLIPLWRWLLGLAAGAAPTEASAK